MATSDINLRLHYPAVERGEDQKKRRHTWSRELEARQWTTRRVAGLGRRWIDLLMIINGKVKKIFFLNRLFFLSLSRARSTVWNFATFFSCRFRRLRLSRHRQIALRCVLCFANKSRNSGQRSDIIASIQFFRWAIAGARKLNSDKKRTSMKYINFQLRISAARRIKSVRQTNRKKSFTTEGIRRGQRTMVISPKKITF